MKLKDVLPSHLIEQDLNDQTELKIWWDNIDPDLQSALKSAININSEPTDQELQDIANIKNFDASDFDLTTISPLYRLLNLEKCILRNTSLEDIKALENLKNLKYVDVTYTFLNDLKSLDNLPNLIVLQCKKTSRLPGDEVARFIKEHPHCKVFWDNEIDQHWLDFMNLDVLDGTDQSPDPQNNMFNTNNPIQKENNMKMTPKQLTALIENKIKKVLKEMEDTNWCESCQNLTEAGKCPSTGCTKKVGNDWRVISNKTGKLWPQTYGTEQAAKDAISAYHVHQ